MAPDDEAAPPGDLRALPVDDGARLVDFAEAPRLGGWSLRSALVRFAQPAPLAASAVLEMLRRTDRALAPYVKRLESRTIADVDDEDDAQPGLVELLEPAVELDRLGDILAAWADDRSLPRPDAEVRAAVERVHAMLERLGVPRESRPPRRAG